MFNNRNRNRGDRWLPLSAGLLASSLAAWPLKAETLLLQPAGELNPGGPDLTVQVPNPAEPLEPQTTPSRQNPQNLPPTEPSPTLEERKTEPDSDTGEAYECSIPVPPADRSPATPTATPTPEDSKTDEAIEAISIAQRGYINSFAYIPTTSEEPNQRLQNRGVPGEVIIKIVEGGLESIRVRRRTGRQRLNLDYVCSRLAIASQPLQVSRLLDALRLLELDPLIKKITAELIPGSQVHRSSLEVKFEEEQTFSVEVAIDNRRAPSVGTVRRQVQLNEANLLGRGDDLSLAYTNTDGSNAFDLSYTLPLNPNNGTIKVAAGTTANRVVEPPFEDVDLRAAARYLDITMRQPLLRTPRQEFAVGLTATRRESGTSILGEDFPLSPGADEKGRSRISALRFFQDWTVRSNEELLAFRSQFSLGLSAFNATVNSEAPDSRFLAWRGQAQWVRRLARDTFVFASSDLQLANRALLPLEQFGLGGFNSVRGYRQDLLLGDNGISASAELRFPIVGRSDRGLGVVQIAPFIDAGTVWNSSGREDFDPQTLVSVGAGLRWEMSDRLAASFYWGIPLVDVNSRQRTWQEKGLHFSVRSRFSF
ncbi:MAG: ShlB/FhaC/HecB family hemolysin secretion/activation protein [Oscillatoriales cyanobacterium]|nr:MAG: ShlB/FhaC/HecB family hemolysin secretion/activation protein [Oscillatoriales cyanobacterium]